MTFCWRHLNVVSLVIVLLIGVLGFGSLHAQDEAGLININTADETMLSQLKGIGAAKARAIVEYREAQPFETIEDIMKVSGIGEKTYESIKDSIVVEVTED